MMGMATDGLRPAGIAAEASEAKLRLLLLGWMIGTGSTGVFIKELAEFLSSRGHEVTCLSAGRSDWRLRPRLVVVQREPYQLIELRNPPVMAGARPDDPLVHVDSPDSTALLRKVVGRLAPHVVAIIDFPGWPANTVSTCQEAGSRVLYYLQNMWPLCTRLSLYSRWRDVCYDFKDGARCVECMADIVGSSAARVRDRIPRWLWRQTRISSAAKRLYRALRHGHGGTGTSDVGDGYARRRAAYIRAINAADLVIGISRGSLAAAARLGVKARSTRELPIRYLAQQELRRARPARVDPAGEPQRVLRVAYIGAVAPEKGAEVLVAAFKGIPDTAARLDIYGNVSPEYQAYLEGISSRSNPPVFHGRYDRTSLPALLAETDLGIVPSTCEDTLPSTVVEFHALGIPVLGSRIGGIPEMIDDERNGLLFEPGSVEALQAALMKVVARADLIEAWRSSLPSNFDPLPCWMEFESVCHELSRELATGAAS